MRNLILIVAILFLAGCATTIDINDNEVLRAYVPRGQTVEYADGKYTVRIDHKPDAFWKTFLLTIGGNLPNVEKD